MNKSIKHILSAQTVDMGGFPVKQALPLGSIQQLDPFLLIHHASTKVIPTKSALHQGVGVHPHRGFSPVSLIIEGDVHHRDSLGNSQIAKVGEVQWMHAGKGITHSERPSQDLVDANGRQEFIQFWVNSPAKHKMKAPSYQYLSETDMPILHSLDGKIKSKLVAGNYNDTIGKAVTQSPLMILWSEAQKTGTETFVIPSNFNTMIYVIRGSIRINTDKTVTKEQLVIFKNDESSNIELAILEDAQFVLFSGAPLDESVTQYGPFVMNTQTEIMQALRDAQMGKMGVLIEEA